MIGLGDKQAKIQVYIENTPPLTTYQTLTKLRPVTNGEIKFIADKTGNHWRKVFNVYAKLCFELAPLNFNTWQELREQHLLQLNSQLALLFSPPQHINADSSSNNNINNGDHIIKIIMGKTYASKLNIAQQALWLNEFFAIDTVNKIIISPYFDYRQLSNIKISQLANLIKKLSH